MQSTCNTMAKNINYSVAGPTCIFPPITLLRFRHTLIESCISSPISMFQQYLRIFIAEAMQCISPYFTMRFREYVQWVLKKGKECALWTETWLLLTRWRHQMEAFSALLAICAGKSPVQWRGALMFSLICARINGWVNNRKAGNLRRICAHYNVIVMKSKSPESHTCARVRHFVFIWWVIP